VNRDDLDRLLAGHDDLQPSSGFAASVMEAVEREASMPPPLPFPWWRALPGAVALIVALAAAIRIGLAAAGDVAPAGPLLDLLAIAAHPQAAWVAAALVLTIVPGVLVLGLMRQHT
jgi:hypothetical protein